MNTPSDKAAPVGDNSFLGASSAAGTAANTGDQIEVKGRVVGRPALNSQISWTAVAVGAHTGAPSPASAATTDSLNVHARRIR